MAKSLRNIIDDLKRPLEENEVWTLLYSSIETLSTTYRDYKPNPDVTESLGPCLIISVDCFLIHKAGQVQFASGLQTEAAKEFAAPELNDGEKDLSVQDLQKTHVYSVGAVLSSLMNQESVNYSERLLSLICNMCSHDPAQRPSLDTILQISKPNTTDSSLNEFYDTLGSEDSDDESVTVEPLAAEFEEVEKQQYLEDQPYSGESQTSGGSSLSLNSRGYGSFDALNTRPSSDGSRGLITYRWSSHERLKHFKDTELKESQFYTPVRSRKKDNKHDPLHLHVTSGKKFEKREEETIPQISVPDNDMPALPPPPSDPPSLPPSDLPSLPPSDLPSLPPSDLPPPNKEVDAIIITSTPKETKLPSLLKIEHILESNSAPDLLKGNKVTNQTLASSSLTDITDDNIVQPTHPLPPDLFVVTSNNDVTEKEAPPTPPPTFPPHLSSLSPLDHHEYIHHDNDNAKEGVVETSLITPPPDPLMSDVGDNTFDYSSSLIFSEPPLEKTTDEFQVAPPPLPLSSPPRLNVDMDEELLESPPPIPLKKLSPESTVVKSLDFDEVELKMDPPTYESIQQQDDEDIKRELIKDENDYTIPFTKKTQLHILQSNEEGVKTLGRPGSQPLKEQEIFKANSADNILGGHHHLPEVTSPERYSMPVESFDTVDIEVLSFDEPESPRRTSVSNEKTTRNKAEKILGEDFSRSRTHSEKRTSTRSKSNDFYLEDHSVIIKAVHTSDTVIRIDAKATCYDLKQVVIKRLNIEEPETFGLAQLIENEYIFLDPDSKLYKYAPKGWLKYPLKKSIPKFVLHFRVMFYCHNISLLKREQTRHIHYLQVFDEVISGNISVKRDNGLGLAALALQADMGDYKKLANKQNYFVPINYLPIKVLSEFYHSNVHETLINLHKKREGLTSDEAQSCYLQEAMKSEDYGYIFYKVSMSKDNTDENYMLGFSTHDLKLVQVNEDEKTLILVCPWKTTTNIAFHNRQIALEVVGTEPINLYVHHYKRAAYFVRMARLCHFFDRKHRHLSVPMPTSDVLKRDSAPDPLQYQEAIYNVKDYSGEFMTVKLLKDEIKGLGITIKQHTSFSQKFAEVDLVKKDGPAAMNGTIKKGDLLIEANEEYLVNRPYQEIGQILKKSPPLVQLVVFRRSNYTPEEEEEPISVVVEIAGNKELSFDQPDTPDKANLCKTSALTLVKESTILNDSGPARSLSVSNDIRFVKLKRKRGSYGFAIAARSKNPYRSACITKITPGGSAEESCQISLGDYIIAVDGQSTDGKSYAEVFKMLRNAGDELELQLCPPGDGSFVTIYLDKKKGALGLRIKKDQQGCTVVSSVTKGSQADKTGLIHPGDEIIQLNGHSLRGLTQREATDLLLNAQSEVNIYLKKSTQLEAVNEETEVFKSDKPATPPTNNTILRNGNIGITDCSQLRAPSSHNDEEFSVKLHKGYKGFGFKIRRDDPDDRIGKGLYIASVDYDPALSDGRLRCGDEILLVNGKSFINIEHRIGVQELRAIESEATFIVKRKKGQEPRVPHIEAEEYPVEVLSNSLQDESYNALSKLLTIVASEEDKEIQKGDKVEYQEEEDQEKLQNTDSTLVSQTTKDIVPSQDQYTIEKLILQVPEDSIPTEEREDEAPPLPSSPPPEGSRPPSLVVTDSIDLLHPKPV